MLAWPSLASPIALAFIAQVIAVASPEVPAVSAVHAGSGDGWQTSAPGQEGLTADHLVHEFGDVPIDGGTVTASFRLKNATASTIRLTELFTSCMCTTVMLEFSDASTAGPFGMEGHEFLTTLDRELAPAEEVLATVTFDPAAHGPAGVGPVTRQVLVRAADGEDLILSLEANVRPPGRR
jgi:Protein of unknown function (DUF1573)